MFVACGGIMEYYFIQKKKVESAVLAADKVWNYGIDVEPAWVCLLREK
jgi:hypothetical protein